jgi:hypothetical protein
VALLLSLAITSGSMAIGAMSVSGLAGGGQVMTSRSEDVTRYDVYKGHTIWQSYSRDAVYQLKRDIFHGKLYSNGLNLDELIRPAALVGTVPKSIDSYRADPTEWPNIQRRCSYRSQAARSSDRVHARSECSRFLLHCLLR